RARHSDRRPRSRRRDVLLPRNAWLGSCPCPNRRTERAHTAEHGRAAVTVAPVARASVRPAACRRRAWVARLVAATALDRVAAPHQGGVNLRPPAEPHREAASPGPRPAEPHHEATSPDLPQAEPHQEAA